MKVGYIRISSTDQRIDRQLVGIEVEKKFIDTSTGRNRERPEYETMMGFLREGDHLVVHSLDRLARNVSHLREIVCTLTKKGVTVEFLKENLKFTPENQSPIAMLMLSLIGAVAEFEIDLSLERQREGIALAKKRGAYKGRQRCLNSHQIQDMKRMLEVEGVTKAYVARKLGIKRQTVYNYIRRKEV